MTKASSVLQHLHSHDASSIKIHGEIPRNANRAHILLQYPPYPNLSHQFAPPDLLSAGHIYHYSAPNSPSSSGEHFPCTIFHLNQLLLHSSSSVYYSARSQPLTSSTTATISTPNNKIIFDLPSYPSSRPLPRSVIELETIKDATRHTRHFFHRYFAELQGSWHEKQMFPEESFAEVPWQKVEERWRRGQGKGGEGLAARGGRVMEWVKRDDVGEWGRQRIGWICKVHGWGYWVREIRWEDDGEDEDGGETEEENERFQDAEE